MRAAIPGVSIYFLMSIVSGQVQAAAQTSAVPPTLKSLDIQKICAGTNPRYLLARTIVQAYKISEDLIDWTDNPNDDQRYSRVVTEALCAGNLTKAQTGKCISPDSTDIPPYTDDAKTQIRMVTDVNTLFEGLQKGGPDFELKDKKSVLHFHRARAVSALDIKREPRLGDANASLPSQIFSEDPVFFELSCSAAPVVAAPGGGHNPPAPASAPGNAPGSAPGNAPQQASAATIFDRFRLRAKSDDLWTGRDDPAFSSLSGASLTTVNDAIAGKNTFDVHLALGYALPAWQNGAAVLDSIPYIQYDRSYVDGSMAPPKSSNVNNIGTGLQERFTFPVTESFYSAVIFQPKYVASLRSGAQIASIHLAYEPEPLVPYLGFLAETPVSGLWASAYARGVLNYYEVLHSSNDGVLNSGNNFVQGGAQVGGVLSVKDAQSPFVGLSFPLDYTYFRGISGPYKSVELLQVGINYTLPKTKYVTVGLSYTTGRNLDTFEQQKVYKASLGLKY
jgi:hypothetical protein